MKLLSERTPESEATPERIHSLLRDSMRRGAWVELRHDDDPDHHLRAVALNGRYFSIERRDGADEWPLVLDGYLPDMDWTEAAFLAYLDGRSDIPLRPVAWGDWSPDGRFPGFPPVLRFGLRATRERTLASLEGLEKGDGCGGWSSYVARPDLDWPASADPRIWPSFFERYDVDSTPAWTEFPDAEFDFRHFLWFNADAPDIVLRTLPPDEASHWVPAAFGIVCRPEDLPATDLPAPWREIGFDVAETGANPYSVLFDMGIGADAILRDWLAPRLNGYGLLPSASDAFTLRDTATSWAREHAPFCLWRVFLRDPIPSIR